MQKTPINALKAMELFLDKYFQKNKGDDLGLLLSDISTTTFTDGETADPAAFEDWLDAILLVTGDRTIKFLSAQQAFDVMISFIKKFGERIKSNEIKTLLEEILNSDNKHREETGNFWLECFKKA
jgi:hypothetical protein